MEQNLSTQQIITMRPLRKDEIEQAADVLNIAERALVGHNLVTAEELETDISLPEVNWDTDIRVALDLDGKMLAYADYWSGPEPHVRLHGFVRIHPDHKGQGIGCAITDWLEERARVDLQSAPEDLRVTLGMRAYATQSNARAFLESRGYRHVRSSYRMTIDLEPFIPQPEFPDGFVVRPIRRDEADLRLAVQAEQEAFLDHYGVIPEPFETYYERRVHYLLNEANIDFSACYLVMDGDQAAAVEFTATSVADDVNTGWIGTLGVRGPWRKHGLGLGLLRTAFLEMKSRGKHRVGLYVDAESLTGALRLYQKAGMKVEYDNCYFEKELRPGKDLARKT